MYFSTQKLTKMIVNSQQFSIIHSGSRNSMGFLISLYKVVKLQLKKKPTSFTRKLIPVLGNGFQMAQM